MKKTEAGVTVQSVVPRTVAAKLQRMADRERRSLSRVIARRLIDSFKRKEARR